MAGNSWTPLAVVVCIFFAWFVIRWFTEEIK